MKRWSSQIMVEKGLAEQGFYLRHMELLCFKEQLVCEQSFQEGLNMGLGISKMGEQRRQAYGVTSQHVIEHIFNKILKHTWCQRKPIQHDQVLVMATRCATHPFVEANQIVGTVEGQFSEYHGLSVAADRGI